MSDISNFHKLMKHSVNFVLVKPCKSKWVRYLTGYCSYMLWTFIACPYTSNFIYFKSEISLCLNKTFGIWMTNTFKTSTYMHWNHLTFRVKTKQTSSNMSKSSSLYFLFIQKVHIYKRTHAIKYMNRRNVLFTRYT